MSIEKEKMDLKDSRGASSPLSNIISRVASDADKIDWVVIDDAVALFYQNSSKGKILLDKLDGNLVSLHINPNLKGKRLAQHDPSYIPPRITFRNKSDIILANILHELLHHYTFLMYVWGILVTVTWKLKVNLKLDSLFTSFSI